MSDAPKPKQITLVISEDASRELLDAAKASVKAAPHEDEQALFLRELQSMISQRGLNGIVETVGTSTKFHSVVSAGN